MKIHWRLWLACGLCSVALKSGFGTDWPQWMGPQRDGIWRESGLLEKFPESGATVKWRIPVAGGYSGPAVADGRVYLTDYLRESGESFNNPGQRAELQGKERVHCLDAATGEEVWKYEYDCAYKISYPAGPRATPTVQDGKVYILGAEGRLTCLNAATGELIWSKELQTEYKVEAPIWGFSSHPLVDGDKLILLVGGEGSVVVAFNKNTGAELWKALSATEPGYAPPIITEAAGQRQLLIWHPQSINSLDPETGKPYWSVPLEPQYGMSIMAPQRSGDYLFASGIGDAAAVLKLNQEKPGADVVWRGAAKTAVYCANSTPLIEDGVIYGADCRSGGLRGVDLKTGERLWESFAPTTGERRGGHGTVFLVKNEDRHLLFSETGDLIIAKLSAKGYDEISRAHIIEPTGECFGRTVVWSHPAFANQCVFARNDKELVCISLAKGE